MTSKAQEWDDRKAEQLRDAAYASIRGKCFVLTGRMWDFRQNIEGRIQAVGGRTDSRVSFGVDYLVLRRVLERVFPVIFEELVEGLAVGLNR